VCKDGVFRSLGFWNTHCEPIECAISVSVICHVKIRVRLKLKKKKFIFIALRSAFVCVHCNCAVWCVCMCALKQRCLVRLYVCIANSSVYVCVQTALSVCVHSNSSVSMCAFKQLCLCVCIQTALSLCVHSNSSVSVTIQN
jgi:hypothetical protein